MKTVSLDFGGKQLSLETGRMAKLADGSVMVRYGDTMILAVAVASKQERVGIDFLPLQVEFREKYASAGKIPGGFFKREARPSEKEILAARLIDRPIRPMFKEGWRYETQLILTTFSHDLENEADVLGAVGASCALMIAGMPFDGPISNVRVGHVDGQFVINPTVSQLKDSLLEIIVSGTDTSIVMVEGESKEIDEDMFVQALEFGHKHVKMLNDLQRQLVAQCEVNMREVASHTDHEELVTWVTTETRSKLVEFAQTAASKEERGARYAEYRDIIIALATEKFPADQHPELNVAGTVSTTMHDIEYDVMRDMILTAGKRLDGRSTTDIRKITCETHVLPRAHGSALFTRGETQSLTTMTLGTKLDRQLIDGLHPKHEKKFMLHYNFPQYSVGETGRFGGTSRREIGHGNLAERGLKPMLPDETAFPYTLRIVSDILESNGSSSMATVCAGTLAMMSGGVPLKKPVAGIAMGLIKEGERVAILSDILGDEDHLGDMDFKVVGTNDGITACQMDIKIQGISMDVIRKALAQARDGRLHILAKMNETISAPEAELSPFAPRLTTIKVDVQFIGAIIGSGGETIRSIVTESGAEVNIEDDGTIVIAATSEEAAQKAVAMIMGLTRMPELGETYNGKVTQIKDGMGAIVEILPKKSGLLHISQIAWERVENVEDVLNIGDRVDVKLLEINDGKYRLSRKALLPKPEGVYDDTQPREGGSSSGGSRGGYGGNRGGGGDRRGGDRDRDRRR